MLVAGCRTPASRIDPANRDRLFTSFLHHQAQRHGHGPCRYAAGRSSKFSRGKIAPGSVGPAVDAVLRLRACRAAIARECEQAARSRRLGEGRARAKFPAPDWYEIVDRRGRLSLIPVDSTEGQGRARRDGAGAWTIRAVILSIIGVCDALSIVCFAAATSSGWTRWRIISNVGLVVRSYWKIRKVSSDREEDLARGKSPTEAAGAAQSLCFGQIGYRGGDGVQHILVAKWLAQEIVPFDHQGRLGTDKDDLLRLPADARVIENANLHADEAPLTGESVPVAKDAQPIEGEVSLGDRAIVSHCPETLRCLPKHAHERSRNCQM